LTPPITSPPTLSLSPANKTATPKLAGSAELPSSNNLPPLNGLSRVSAFWAVGRFSRVTRAREMIGSGTEDWREGVVEGAVWEVLKGLKEG
jgi:hypothetical protein